MHFYQREATHAVCLPAYIRCAPWRVFTVKLKEKLVLRSRIAVVSCFTSSVLHCIMMLYRHYYYGCQFFCNLYSFCFSSPVQKHRRAFPL